MPTVGPTVGPTGHNLAEAQWSLTDGKNREKQCDAYRTKGREGVADILNNNQEKFLDDYVDLLKRLCPATEAMT